MSAISRTVLLLVVSNLFMLTAWYLHLKTLNHRPWYVASLASWGIAFFEYTVHIPANRIGHTALTLPQLQVLQVGLSLVLFIPFAVVVMEHPVRMDYVWASLCLIGAAYFIFRGVL
ncbi:MAG: DMT family protein [Thermoanaerobaculia bacterium]|nr:DMT family protein [Thermoanaerobaculia bacterium]